MKIELQKKINDGKNLERNKSITDHIWSTAEHKKTPPSLKHTPWWDSQVSFLALSSQKAAIGHYRDKPECGRDTNRIAKHRRRGSASIMCPRGNANPKPQRNLA